MKSFRTYNSLSPQHRTRLGVAAISLSLLAAAGCSQPARSGGNQGSAAMQQNVQQVNDLQTKREAYEKQIKTMSMQQLAEAMTADSAKDREPFNSAAYREAITRGEGAAAALKPLLTQPDRSSLLGLLALRRLSPAQYHSLDPAFRVNVLVNSLASSKYFNTWGVPNDYWEDAARALLEEGSAAAEPLLRLLRDTRPAPVFGSEGAAINAEFHYRVCDYALALLNEIRNHKVVLPASPAERDRLIQNAVAGR